MKSNEEFEHSARDEPEFVTNESVRVVIYDDIRDSNIRGYINTSVSWVASGSSATILLIEK